MLTICSPHISTTPLLWLSSLLIAGLIPVNAGGQTNDGSRSATTVQAPARRFCTFDGKPYSQGAMISDGKAVLRCDHGRWRRATPAEQRAAPSTTRKDR
jgi:hypothetical protein